MLLWPLGSSCLAQRAYIVHFYNSFLEEPLPHIALELNILLLPSQRPLGLDSWTGTPGLPLWTQLWSSFGFPYLHTPLTHRHF